jgi:hypothetical protein
VNDRRSRRGVQADGKKRKKPAGEPGRGQRPKARKAPDLGDLRGRRPTTRSRERPGAHDDAAARKNGASNGTGATRKRSRKGPERAQAPQGDFVGSMYQPDANRHQHGIFVPGWALQVTRTRAELLVVAQLAYWFGVGKKGKVRAKIVQDGHHWVAKTYKKMAEETHLTPGQVRGAVRSLKGRALLVVADDVAAGHLVRYRLDPGKIQQEVEAASSGSPAGEEDDDG